MGGHSGDLLVQAVWREDMFMFEVHHVLSLGPISHRISTPTMAHAGKGPNQFWGFV